MDLVFEPYDAIDLQINGLDSAFQEILSDPDKSPESRKAELESRGKHHLVLKGVLKRCH